jgi:hypothetical protein
MKNSQQMGTEIVLVVDTGVDLGEDIVVLEGIDGTGAAAGAADAAATTKGVGVDS